jgi:hypothetical protein
MRLLELALKKDGLSMSIVGATEKKGKNWLVVDGFHKVAICQGLADSKDGLKGYIPKIAGSVFNQMLQKIVYGFF